MNCIALQDTVAIFYFNLFGDTKWCVNNRPNIRKQWTQLLGEDEAVRWNETFHDALEYVSQSAKRWKPVHGDGMHSQTTHTRETWSKTCWTKKVDFVNIFSVEFCSRVLLTFCHLQTTHFCVLNKLWINFRGMYTQRSSTKKTPAFSLVQKTIG